MSKVKPLAYDYGFRATFEVVYSIKLERADNLGRLCTLDTHARLWAYG